MLGTTVLQASTLVRSAGLCFLKTFRSLVKQAVRLTCCIGGRLPRSQCFRYLLAQKPCEEEQKHHVRLMWGNGLRAEIWNKFVSRFGIQRIGELYGSTEGNSNIGMRSSVTFHSP